MSSEQDIAIRIEGLGKKYMLGETHQLTRTFRETLMDLPRVLGRKAKRGARRAAQVVKPGPVNHTRPTHGREEFWALRDIHMEIKRGEAVGIIGRNGAGKSTLLKVLSRITAPTTGRAEIRGRVGALLEVGTGMNPELTGRENIFLNGSIIGMTKREIDAKFDEIVNFAGVERFLDTPLKRYSSGMRVRLGFAVAAHLEPEILIVDEVLSVGDAEFQRKCLGKMEDVAGEGRTVLFVSHNLMAVENLCERAFVLDAGELVRTDVPDRAISFYMNQLMASSRDLDLDKYRKGSGGARVRRVWFEDDQGNPLTEFRSGAPACFRLEIDSTRAYERIEVAINVYSHQQSPLFRLSSRATAPLLGLPEGLSQWRCRVPRLPLIPGPYPFELVIYSDKMELLDFVYANPIFEVLSGDFFGTGFHHPQNPVLVDHDWAQC